MVGDQRRAASVNMPELDRSEEHTSELQSQSKLVCRLLLEKTNSSNTPMTVGVPATSQTCPCLFAMFATGITLPSCSPCKQAKRNRPTPKQALTAFAVIVTS